MKFRISLENENLPNVLRRYGYVPDGQDQRTGELRFFKSITGRRYPRFHLYCVPEESSASCNLHLDQKQPSYQGSAAHSGEYEGNLVESEAERIRSLA
ncbi:MAG: hypothetical protein Q8P12_06935 [bacterium]|nr:hypothetical protein [bacterium]